MPPEGQGMHAGQFQCDLTPGPETRPDAILLSDPDSTAQARPVGSRLVFRQPVRSCRRWQLTFCSRVLRGLLPPRHAPGYVRSTSKPERPRQTFVAWGVYDLSARLKFPRAAGRKVRSGMDVACAGGWLAGQGPRRTGCAFHPIRRPAGAFSRMVRAARFSVRESVPRANGGCLDGACGTSLRPGPGLSAA